MLINSVQFNLSEFGTKSVHQPMAEHCRNTENVAENCCIEVALTNTDKCYGTDSSASP